MFKTTSGSASMGSGDNNDKQGQGRAQEPTCALNEGVRIQATTPHAPPAPLDLDALRAMAGAATPGPWHGTGQSIVNMSVPFCVAHCPSNGGSYIGAKSVPTAKANVVYIVAACNAVPALIDGVQALRDRLRDAEAQRDALLAQFESAVVEVDPDSENEYFSVILASGAEGTGSRLEVDRDPYKPGADAKRAAWQQLIDAARAGAAKGDEKP